MSASIGAYSQSTPTTQLGSTSDVGLIGKTVSASTPSATLNANLNSAQTVSSASAAASGGVSIVTASGAAPAIVFGGTSVGVFPTLATAVLNGSGAATVDLSSQFADLITTQQAYSASAKVITTADTMEQSLLATIQ